MKKKSRSSSSNSEANNNSINEPHTKKNQTSSDILNEILSDYNNLNKNTITENKSGSKKNNNPKTDKINIFEWQTLEDTVICKAYNNFTPGEKLLSFDLDDTLIIFETTSKKKGKNKSPNKSADNSYKFAFDIKKIIQKLEEYSLKKYIFAIFSNQNGISAGHVDEKNLKNKIDKIFSNEFKNFPFVFIGAKEKDFYRKPSIGMLELFTKYFNNNTKIDFKNSIFVGDGAGRPKTKSHPKKDFSDSDYKFALNCNFNFYTPEEFFLGVKSDYPKIENPLKKYTKNNNDHIKFNDSPKFKEVIICIGAPGSGKSTFCENVLVPKNYIRINQDDLKSKNNVMKKLEESLKNNKKIVIDSTNPTKKNREDLINVIKKYNDYEIRVFNFDVSKELAMHLNNLRRINKYRKHFSEAVNVIPIHTFFKYYEEPNKNEGFNEIVKVNFVPGPFDSENDEKLFYCLS